MYQYFIDWVTTYQDFDFELPLIGDQAFLVVDMTIGKEGDILATKCPSINHEGSFSTSIQIRISGNRLTVSGNPSRINRLENLFGFRDIEMCYHVYNRILESYGLPPFTKCTYVRHVVDRESSKLRKLTDGAIITEIHITTNKSVGQGCEDDYIKAISTQPYRNSIPRLHTNGKTCDWLSKAGRGGRLIYPSIYNKAYELRLHALPKILRKFGDESDEYQYLLKVITYCEAFGVVRFEQKIKSEFLRRENLNIYGQADLTLLNDIHTDFLNLDKKLQVEKMSLENISERLLREGICDSVRAANTTSLYAIQWASGASFDFNKSQVKNHRARLRKIGIDIALVCDVSKFSLVQVRETKTINLSYLPVPSWYRKAEQNYLRAV
jgi:hypothetical protein